MQKITPFLWFNDNAEEAMNFYVSIFKNSRIVSVSRYGDGGRGPKGQVMTGTFELEGQRFMALNGGPLFKFTEAISLFVDCEGQPEVDSLWEKLSAGGEKSRCGWLKDKFGVSWQVIPKAARPADGRQGPGEVQAGDDGDAADGQDRCAGLAARLRRGMTPESLGWMAHAGSRPDARFLLQCGMTTSRSRYLLSQK
jgi:predicted 3-demethylubiquinone-9 3-methyltransferase (glyoxalase superfamily)